MVVSSLIFNKMVTVAIAVDDQINPDTYLEFRFIIAQKFIRWPAIQLKASWVKLKLNPFLLYRLQTALTSLLSVRGPQANTFTRSLPADSSRWDLLSTSNYGCSPLIKRRPVIEKKVPVGSARVDTWHHKVRVLPKHFLGRAQRFFVVAVQQQAPPLRAGQIESHLQFVRLVFVPELRKTENAR